MSTLTLRLSAPLQAWGASSRFDTRDTCEAPTKSGIIGLLAAAKGLRRTDDLEELAHLRFGVRIDQPGELLRDFHTRSFARGANDVTNVSTRYYLTDAVFLAAIEADHDVLLGLAEAIRNPVFPLYLGRRSCPPAGPVLPVVHEDNLDTVLDAHPWVAAGRVQQGTRAPSVHLTILKDARPGDRDVFEQRDAPVTFDPIHRQYLLRRVVRSYADISNPTYQPTRVDHDPMAALGA